MLHASACGPHNTERDQQLDEQPRHLLRCGESPIVLRGVQMGVGEPLLLSCARRLLIYHFPELVIVSLDGVGSFDSREA